MEAVVVLRCVANHSKYGTNEFMLARKCFELVNNFNERWLVKIPDSPTNTLLFKYERFYIQGRSLQVANSVSAFVCLCTNPAANPVDFLQTFYPIKSFLLLHINELYIFHNCVHGRRHQPCWPSCLSDVITWVFLWRCPLCCSQCRSDGDGQWRGPEG